MVPNACETKDLYLFETFCFCLFYKFWYRYYMKEIFILDNNKLYFSVDLVKLKIVLSVWTNLTIPIFFLQLNL